MIRLMSGNEDEPARLECGQGRHGAFSNPPAPAICIRHAFGAMLHVRQSAARGHVMAKGKQELRSRLWFDNPDNPGMTALYLERYLNYGLTREELQSGKPIIG